MINWTTIDLADPKIDIEKLYREFLEWGSRPLKGQPYYELKSFDVYDVINWILERSNMNNLDFSWESPTRKEAERMLFVWCQAGFFRKGVMSARYPNGRWWVNG